ncbi:type VI secretion system baseplate subunit TssG [soil metagenome]
MKSSSYNTPFDETLRTDFKAEVIAAELVDSGTPLDRILILMLGGAKRPYRKDVDEIIEEISDYDHKEYTHVKTHKEGIYDMLPEGLFHSPTLPKSATDEKEIIVALKKHHIEEANARKFFLPYEASINELRIQMALHESRLDKRLDNSEMVDIFASQWEIFKWLDARQANIFLHLLPLLHDVRDDYGVAETIFELIFLLPAEITLQQQKPVRLENQIFSSFDNSILGVNFTTSNKVFYTGENEIVVSIGPMPNSMLQGFIAGGNNEKILELLCDYLLPVHIDTNVEFKLLDSDKTTRLADYTKDYNSTLGLSTYL